jgi:hypothetical protein
MFLLSLLDGVVSYLRRYPLDINNGTDHPSWALSQSHSD